MQSEPLTQKECDEGLYGVQRGSEYLGVLVLAPKNAGLISVDMIVELHTIVMEHRNSTGGFSHHNRGTVNCHGREVLYVRPQDIGNELYRAVDAYNATYDLPGRASKIEALTQFTREYLRIHPFNDGNGRIAKLLIWYGVKVQIPDANITFPPYPDWEDYISRANSDVALHSWITTCMPLDPWGFWRQVLTKDVGLDPCRDARLDRDTITGLGPSKASHLLGGT